jgi:hypothetical protein
MKMKNEKGAIVLAAGVVYALVGVATLAAFLFTPLKNLIQIPGEGSKSVQKQIYTTKQVPYVNPTTGKNVRVTNADGSTTLLMQEESSNQTLDENTKPELTIWQKLMQIGWWWIALTIIGFFWGPLGTVMALINGKAKKAALAIADAAKVEAEKLTFHSKKIVASVDAAFTEFDDAIKAAQTAYDTAKNAAAATTDPSVLAANNGIMDTQQNMINTLTKLKRSMKDAMTMVQGRGSSTETTVTKLQGI